MQSVEAKQEYQRAMRLYDEGRLEDARQILVKILDAYPDYIEALNALAVTTEDLGNRNEAIDLYRRVLRIRPDYTRSAARLRQLERSRSAAQMQSAASDPYLGSSGTAGVTTGRSFEGTLAYRLAQGEPASPGKERHHLRRSLRTFLPTFIIAGLLLAAIPIIRGGTETSSGYSDIYNETPPYETLLPLAAAVLVIWNFLRYATTHYQIFDARIDLRKGVLFRRHRVLWLYEIDRRIEVRQSALQTLLATGSILIEADALPASRLQPLAPIVTARQTGRIELIGIGHPRKVRRIAEEIRTLALRERRAMLNYFMSR